MHSDKCWPGRIRFPLVLLRGAGNGAERRRVRRSTPLGPHVQDLHMLPGKMLV